MCVERRTAATTTTTTTDSMLRRSTQNRYSDDEVDDENGDSILAALFPTSSLSCDSSLPYILFVLATSRDIPRSMPPRVVATNNIEHWNDFWVDVRPILVRMETWDCFVRAASVCALLLCMLSAVFVSPTVWDLALLIGLCIGVVRHHQNQRYAQWQALVQLCQRLRHQLGESWTVECHYERSRDEFGWYLIGSRVFCVYLVPCRSVTDYTTVIGDNSRIESLPYVGVLETNAPSSWTASEEESCTPPPHCQDSIQIPAFRCSGWNMLQCWNDMLLLESSCTFAAAAVVDLESWNGGNGSSGMNAVWARFQSELLIILKDVQLTSRVAVMAIYMQFIFAFLSSLSSSSSPLRRQVALLPSITLLPLLLIGLLLLRLVQLAQRRRILIQRYNAKYFERCYNVHVEYRCVFEFLASTTTGRRRHPTGFWRACRVLTSPPQVDEVHYLYLHRYQRHQHHYHHHEHSFLQ